MVYFITNSKNNRIETAGGIIYIHICSTLRMDWTLAMSRWNARFHTILYVDGDFLPVWIHVVESRGRGYVAEKTGGVDVLQVVRRV